MSKLSVSQLYEDLREELKLSILSGESGMSRWINHTHFQKKWFASCRIFESCAPG